MDNKRTADIIKAVCKQKKIAIKTMLENCKINRNFMYDLEKREAAPSVDKLAQIADYLNCSVDYLLGRTDNPRELTENQQELLSLFNQIEDERTQVKALGQFELILNELTKKN